LNAATGSLDSSVSDLKTATNNLNTTKLNASETNALAVTKLQITGGSPTNGAVWMATNTVGQGGWLVYPKLLATRNTDKNFPNGNVFTSLECTNVLFQRGGSYSGSQWSPALDNCWVTVIGYIVCTPPPQTGRTELRLYRNGALYLYGQNKGYTATQYPDAAATWSFWNVEGTNVYDVGLCQLFVGGCTNQNGISSIRVSFEAGP